MDDLDGGQILVMVFTVEVAVITIANILVYGIPSFIDWIKTKKT